ncbi:undecaprenyl-phosphate glucose phosphotransferase [Vibrio sp. 05-20-BW147]|uniref:undecaprenyl-phosphate glucose phosphotransferase n=1 Tax=Vibrio sp. 05-20-BW147 TaxID=2575834 RepID=UPI0015930865|nr:undecaprenyl-phosphate glucose phosphotransferase [Vibrio sp. 05-20-BW147]NVC62482.1 undecaprenyl-phosphate glucose phosphotransferase [Vibrio sp. 05-20-BW147]
MTPNKALKFADDGYATLLKVADFLLINLSLSFLVEWMGETETAIDVMASFVLSILFLLVGEYFKLYGDKTIRRMRLSSMRLLLVMVLSAILMDLVRHAFAGMEGVTVSNLTNALFNTWYLLIFLVSLALRISIIGAVRLFRKYTNQTKRVAIIGLTPAGLAISKSLFVDAPTERLDVAFYDDRDEERFGYLSQVPYCGKVDLAIEKARNGELEEVYIALPMIAKDRIRDYLDALSDSTVDTYLVPDLYTYNLSISQVKSVGGVQTFSVFSSPFDGVGAFVKRIEDIVIGSLITLLILPVLAAVAIGVKLSSPGPILFKQDRYGLGGKKIKVWKFRSMKVMENESVVTQATKNDPRVTKFGAFIRRTSLDELPQFINVLQGSMSIVGPRPHAVAHNEEYRVIVDNYMIRHKIKPGITGWAQINGYRGETETVDKMEKRVQYDIQYMQNWNLWLDIKIIFMTIFKGFVSETAY